MSHEAAKIYHHYYKPSFNIFRLLKSVLSVFIHGSAAASSAVITAEILRQASRSFDNNSISEEFRLRQDDRIIACAITSFLLTPYT